MTPRIPRAAAGHAAELSDAESTYVSGLSAREPDEQQPVAPAGARRPAFVQSETVVPTVSYRHPTASPGPTQPAQARPAAGTPAAGTQDSAAPAGHQVNAAWYSPPQHELSAALAGLDASVMRQPPRSQHHAVAPAAAAQWRGELTVVFGCRGGAGATTLAVNTAAALTRTGRSVCVVDLDLQLGDVFTALDLEPQTSLTSVAREAHALDGISLRRRLGQHASGVCALTQVGHIDDLDPTLPARLPALLDILRTHFDYVIVDGVRDFGDLALVAIEAASKILVVVTQDVPAVRRAARVLGLVHRLGIPEGRCALVVNRAVRGAAVDQAAITRALALPVSAAVREDARVATAIDAGALLLDVARSRAIVSDLAKVAALCSSSTPRAAEAPVRKRWFGKAGAR